MSGCVFAVSYCLHTFGISIYCRHQSRHFSLYIVIFLVFIISMCGDGCSEGFMWASSDIFMIFLV
jgi:hypothetical protein